MSIAADKILPAGWKGYLDPDYPRIGVGIDVATTTKKKSNPSAIALTQEIGLRKVVRLVIRFKTDDPDAFYQIVDQVIDLPHDLRIARLCIDGTNERFFAGKLRKYLAGRVPTEILIGSESIEIMGETMSFKTYLGNLFVNTITDGYLELPDSDWLKKDIRQVYTNRGSFDADVDAQGNHADCFDAIKNSLHALRAGSAHVQAKAVSTGHTASVPLRPGIKNPLAKKVRRITRRLHA